MEQSGVNGQSTPKQRLYGRVSTRAVQLTRSYLIRNGCQLLTHQQALERLSQWFKFQFSRTNIGIASKHPVVFKSKRELLLSNIDEYKVIILPSAEIYSKQSVSAFKHFINFDYCAEIRSMRPLMKPFGETDLAAMRRVDELVERGQSLMDALLPLSPLPPPSPPRKKKTVISPLDATLGVIDEWFERVPDPRRYASFSEWLRQRINSVVLVQDQFKTVQMRGGVKFQTMLQGRNSVIRNAVARRCRAFRGQILLRPDLKPNQVIFPYTWQQDLETYAKRLVDITDAGPIPSECFIDIPFRIGQKRDPAINQNAFSFYNQLAFAKSENIYVNPGEIGHKNADFDGDTMMAHVFNGDLDVMEIDMNMIPRNNMLCFGGCRVTFTEAHVLAMHQRPVPSSLWFAHPYNQTREREIIAWRNNPTNVTELARIKKLYPHIDFEQFIEPTRSILEKTLYILAQCEGSRSAFEFFTFINQKTLELANGIRNELWCDHLPGEYFMGDNLLCETMIRVCMSGAKGSIATFASLTEKFQTHDGTTDINTTAEPLSRKNLFDELDSTSKAMAVSSKRVQINGHAFFKTNIGYDLISFDRNKLHFLGKEIHPHVDFLPPISVLNTDIALYLASTP